MRATSSLAFGYQVLPSLNKGFTYLLTYYPWSKFYFLSFQTAYHTLPYPKTYLPWRQSTLVVDSGDSLFLTSPGPLSPTVNSPNNSTTGRINKSSKQDPRVALCCSLVFIKKILKKEFKKIYIKNFEEEARLNRQYIVTVYQFHNKKP